MASSARLDELRKKFDENPRRYFAPLANEYRKVGETDQAIAICREYLPQQPGHMSGHIVFGQALYEARQFEEAKTVFETALSLDPENLIALRHLGDISLILGETDAARGWYRRVLDADPRNEEIQAQLASLDKAASAAPTPAVSRAQTLEAPAVPPQATPSSAPTVVVSAMKAPPAAPAAPTPPAPIPAAPAPPPAPSLVTATSPTAEIRLEDIIPPAAKTAEAIPAVSAREPESLSTASTIEITGSAVDGHATGPGAHAPLEGLETHAAVPEPPPLDSFSLEGLETTSMAAPAPPSPPPAAPAPAPPIEVAPADELAPLDLDLGSVGAPPPAPAASTPVPEPLPAAEVEPVPAVAAPEPVPIQLEDVTPPPIPAQEPALSTELEFITEAPAPPSAAAPVEPPPAAPESPFVTETMAELYLQQGHREEALKVYRALSDQRPDDEALREKVRRIEAEMTPAASEQGGPPFGDVLRMVAMRKPGFRPEPVQGNGAAAPARAVETPETVPEPTAPEASAAPAPPPPSAPVPARGDALGSALGFSVATPGDEQAAMTLAVAFASNGVAAGLSGAPARPASNELSLDSVFGGEKKSGPPAPPPSSFSFDQFFADRQAATAGGATGSRESPEEVAQFTQWLEGLKRR